MDRFTGESVTQPKSANFIRYSSIVFPLTLLSAYLLLSKPHHLSLPRTEGEGMGEFFEPWRRKFGVATLVMSCLFAAGWVRSLRTADLIQFRKPPNQTSGVVSASGIIGYFRWDRECWTNFQPSRSSIGSLDLCQSGPVEFLNLYAAQDLFKRHRILPFRVSLNRDLGPDRSRLEEEGIWGPNIIATGDAAYIPYSSLILPLTAMSSYLLLSKPRNAARVPA